MYRIFDLTLQTLSSVVSSGCKKTKQELGGLQIALNTAYEAYDT